MAYTVPVLWSAGDAITSAKLNAIQNNILHFAARPRLLVTGGTSYTVGAAFATPLGMTGTINVGVPNARLEMTFNAQLTTSANTVFFIKFFIDDVQVMLRQMSMNWTNHILSTTYYSPTQSAGNHNVRVEVSRSTAGIQIDTGAQFMVQEI